MNKSKKERVVKIGPETFIHGPFVKCPKCKKEAFGILSIGADFYTRRCRECLFPKRGDPAQRFKLPKLHKKIVYLDQNAISNMMLAQNPQTKAYQQGKVPTFWKEFFEKTDEAVKLQLIICPDSSFHGHESLLSQFSGELQKMYERFSFGTSFNDPDTIHRFQLICQFKRWLGDTVKDIEVGSITHGQLHGWHDLFHFSIPNIGWSGLIDELRQNKDIVAEGLKPVFQRWMSEKDKDFDFWVREETNAYAGLIIACYKRDIENRAKFPAGITVEPGMLLPGMASTLIYEMDDILRGKKIKETEVASSIMDFFRSTEFHETPHVKISSMLWASVARKAAAGQRKPPNKGFKIDVDIISTLLPYCDAMFIDDVCRSYLIEKPLSKEVKKYKVKIFSTNNVNDYFKYIDQIKRSAPKKHFDKVEEVYGLI